MLLSGFFSATNKLPAPAVNHQAKKIAIRWFYGTNLKLQPQAKHDVAPSQIPSRIVRRRAPRTEVARI